MSDFAFNPSYAEDCARVRPDWTPDDGQASTVTEFFILLTTPLGFAWFALLILLLWTRNGWLGAVFGLACLALSAQWIAHYSLDDDLYLGSVGGCVGSLNAALGVLGFGFLLGLAIAARGLQDWFRSRTRI